MYKHEHKMAPASCLKGVPELCPKPLLPVRCLSPYITKPGSFLLILWPKIVCFHFCTAVHLQQAAHFCTAYSLIFKILP